MTNDETILREVDQALAEDTTAESIRKNLPAIIGAALIVVVGVGGWQVWSRQQASAAAKASVAYDEALKISDADQSVAALEALAGKGGGYGALAKLRLAGALASKGDNEKALGLYREIYGSGGGSKRLKDMARLRAAYLSLAEGRDAVLKDAGPLETDETEIGFYAREVIALAALHAGDYQSAEEMFRKAASSPDAPEPVRLRGAEFAALAGAGKAGVVFPEIETSTKSDVDRYFDTLEQAGSDLSSIVTGDEAPAPDAVPDAAIDDPAVEAPVAEKPVAEAPATPEGNE